MLKLDLTSRQGCRRCRGILLLSAGLLLVAALYGVEPPQPVAGGNCVFRIGEFDGSSLEFAPKDFAGEENYVIGRSQPATGWRAFQPAVLSAALTNPNEAAAHSRTIEFQIPDTPASAYRFKVALLFEQTSFPALRVTINGKSGIYYPEPKLDYRMGDTIAAQDPVYSTADIGFVFPGSLLQQGLNTIALQAVDDAVEAIPESGFTYDAVELDRWEPGSVDSDTSTRIDPTVYFRKRPDGLSELVNVTIRSPRRLSPEDTVSLLLDGQTYQKKLGISRDFGEARIAFEVPEFPAQSVARVNWGAGDASVSAEQKIAPRKKWTIFLVPHIHLDVGFTDFQAKVAVIQAQVMDEAMDLIAKYPDFRFSVDGEWCLEQFMKTRSAREQERVIAAIRNQRLYIPAQYANLLTGLPTAETLIRSLYPSANFSREHGTPFDYANIADVPSYSWSYASVLAAAGIRDFVAAAHDHRAATLMQGRLNEHSPFWWEAPDGQKVLFYYTRSYLQMEMLFGLPPVLSAGIETMPVFLQQYEQPDYPASAAIIYGTQEENRALFPQQAELAGKWNAEWAYPRMENAGFHDAIETIRQQCGDAIPTFSGDGGPYWELGAGSDARYVAMERENEARGASAEKLSTIASLIDPRIAVDKPALDDMWTNMILMDEHTWDSWYSVTDPDTVEAKKQLAVKDSYAIRAQASVDSLACAGLATLSNSISAGTNSLIVFNTLNWPRSGLVEFDLEKKQELADPSSGSPIPLQLVRQLPDVNHVRFEAENIPALGYKVYQLRASTGAMAQAAPGRDATLESPYYRVELDPASGAVRSIYDKELHRELVDQGSDYRFGQYLYVTDTDPAQNQSKTWYLKKLDLQVHPAGNGKIISVTRMPYGWEAKMESTAVSTPTIATTLRLFEHQKKIELVEDVDKDAVSAKEGVYFAFPFAIDHPRFQYEIQTTAMDPARDMYPGAGHEWFSVQHWVSAQADGVSASVLPIDVPLITLGDIDRGQWLDSFGERRAAIFSFAMNNYWEDNYVGSQGGHFQFRYVVTSASSTDEGQLSRMGWEEATPLEVDEITLQDKTVNDSRPLDGRQASLAQISDPNVLLDTVKPAEDRDGTILRLLDLGGTTRPVSIRLPAFRFSSAWQTDAVERNQGQLAVKDGHEFTVTMHPHEIVTVRIATNGP
jgi:alpha-mannosidase